MGLFDKLFGKEKMYEFYFDEAGKHQIGGDFPNDLKIPENQFKSNFQYIGLINPDDELFSWLPFELHLICPIYLDFEFVYLDYQIPLEPKIIYPTDTADIGSAYRTLNLDSKIVFDANKVSTREFAGVTQDNEFDVIGIAGKPNWTQNANVPICPKTNKKMKFVCQFTSWTDIKTKYTNVIAESDYEQKLFEKMNFWGDGDLYIFMQPDSKTVCYFIQNT